MVKPIGCDSACLHNDAHRGLGSVYGLVDPGEAGSLKHYHYLRSLLINMATQLPV